MKNRLRAKKAQKKSRNTKLTNSTKVRLPENYPWKVIGHLLDDVRQYLTPEEYRYMKSIIRFQNVPALMEMSDVWGLQISNVPGQMLSPDQIGARCLLAGFLKKFPFPGHEEKRQVAATKKFLEAELACRSYNHSGYKTLVWSEDPVIVDIFTFARGWIQKCIGFDLPEFDTLTEHSRHGPGASSNTVRGNTSSYFKYKEWPYDCTRRARGKAIAAIKADERWLGALEQDYRRVMEIPTHCILDWDAFWSHVLHEVPGNRITFVPKSWKIDRTIAIEPTLNLYLQLGVDGFMRRRLKRWGVDLNSQVKNRELARLGSQNDGDDSFVTLDLSAASDSISLALCRHLLPPAWYRYLYDLRSPVGELGSKSLSYEKISSMGNGYTFALESLIFTSLVYAVMKVHGEPDLRSAAVFGDDIIVRKKHADLLVKALSAAGFSVNTEKSFLKGPCRESCGADWFQGKPVRPVFLDAKPTDIKELFNDYNRIKRLLELRFGITESSTLALLRSWIPSKFKTFHGPYSNEEFDTYIHMRYPIGPYKNGSFRFRRLVRRPRTYKAGRLDGWFRKLMASLYPQPEVKPFYKRPGFKVTESTQGSTFEVPLRNSWYFALAPSTADFWRDEYAEVEE